MIDEPDIVKQLREEERLGKLKYEKFSLMDKFYEIFVFKSKEYENYYDDVKINSYKDALNLAKRVLNDLDKN